MPLMRHVVLAGGILLWTSPADAQSTPRGFITLTAAAQASPAELTDRIAPEINAETALIETRYPSRAAVVFDGGFGFRLKGRVGAAVTFSHGTSSGNAVVRASVPHPFFDDQDRPVEGDASGMSRTESAAHLQVFYELPVARRWAVRLFGGPSYIRLEQELVRNVTVEETFPYDTAVFQSAVTGAAKGSGIGFNVGADASWMFARRVGAGLLVRYARAGLELSAPDRATVSSDGGGVQAGAGIRFVF